MERNTYYSHGQGLKLVESKTERRLGAEEDNVRRNYYPNNIRPDSTSELSGVVHYEEVNPDILFNNGMVSTPKSRYKMGGNKNKMRLCLKNKLQRASLEVEFTREEEGRGIHFIPITDNTRKFVAVQFGIMDENFKEMPKYIFGGIAKGLKAPKYVFHMGDDGNCLFRAISYILTGSEDMHFTVRQSICDYIEVHYQDLQPFCNF